MEYIMLFFEYIFWMKGSSWNNTLWLISNQLTTAYNIIRLAFIWMQHIIPYLPILWRFFILKASNDQLNFSFKKPCAQFAVWMWHVIALVSKMLSFWQNLQNLSISKSSPAFYSLIKDMNIEFYRWLVRVMSARKR